MSRRELQPLPADIAALLAAERRAPRPSGAREAAIYARVEAAVGAAAITPTVAAAVQAGGRYPALAGGAATAKGLAASKTLLATLALVTGGLGAVASTYLALRPSSPAVVMPASPVEATARGAPVPASPAPSAPLLEPLPPAAPARQTAPAVAPRSARPADDLTAESALLERARRALERGAPEAALVEVKRHARLFARGHLVEERDALWIKALAASGHGQAARARASSFQQRFPRSIQQDAIARALREIP